MTKKISTQTFVATALAFLTLASLAATSPASAASMTVCVPIPGVVPVTCATANASGFCGTTSCFADGSGSAYDVLSPVQGVFRIVMFTTLEFSNCDAPAATQCVTRFHSATSGTMARGTLCAQSEMRAIGTLSATATAQDLC